MNLSETIQTTLDDPAALESLYREAHLASDEEHFREAIEGLYQSNPKSILLQAWHHRLASHQLTPEPPGEAVAKPVDWVLAGILSLVTGLVFWVLSAEDLTLLSNRPALIHLWAPVATLFILGFLSSGAPERRRRALVYGGSLALITLYVLLVGRLDFQFQQQFADLIAIHLPFLSWAAVGLTLTTFASDPRSLQGTRFAFIRKSMEVFVTGGLYLIAGMIFGGITFGMFEALDVTLPDAVTRLIAAGGAGLLPMIAVASVYDASRPPARQSFGQGVGRLVPIVTQLLLPLSVVVLLVYIVVIPFNFYGPFRDRDVLIVYNVMLFAVVALLVGITPIRQEDIAPPLRPWVRRGVIILAVLAVVVGLYALAAVVSRTVAGGWTLNRITVIGWNAINIGLLMHVAVTQLKLKGEDWTHALKKGFARGAMAYLAWALGLMLLLPLLSALL
jgi:hypothetical protein